MSAPVALRGNYTDLFGPGMLPVLEELFMSQMQQAPLQRDQIFKVVPHDRDIWQSSAIHDLDQFQQIAEGADYTFKRPKQGNSKTLTIVKWGLGFSISEEMVDDGKFDLVGDMVQKLAKSGRESQEVQAMNIFNNGFSTETADDGLSVFNSAHTLPSGLTYRNQPAVMSDLSASSLEQAITDFDTIFIGDSGIFYRKQVKKLIVHPANKLYAKELVQSQGRPDTADNNINSLNMGIEVIASPRLTDPDAWFLTDSAPETGLRIIQRKPLETKAAGSDLGFVSDSILYKARYREKIGVTHSYGIYGNSGG